MSKIYSKIISLLCTPTVPIVVIAPILSSCSNSEEKVTRIELQADSDTIRPGENVLIRATLLPSRKRTQDLNWSLDQQHEGLTISNDGTVSLSSSTVIEKPFNLQVTATSPNDPEVSNSVSISVLPEATYDFQGFLDNEFTYVNRKHEIMSMQFQQEPGTMEYSLPQAIDVFEVDILPEGCTSWFNFVPLIAGKSEPYMRFELKGGDYQQHAIKWTDGYADGTWTTTIPNFDTYNFNVINDTILVSFACDPRVKLSIDVHAWLNQWQQEVDACFAYYPTFPGDRHDIEPQEEGIYRTCIYCPAEGTSGTYQATLDSIYCFRPKYQYADFEFRIQMNKDLDPEIASMFHTDPGESIVFRPQVIQRDIDNFRYYKFIVNYQFDLSKRVHSADYFHYRNFLLCQIIVSDTLFDPSAYSPGHLDIYVDWI